MLRGNYYFYSDLQQRLDLSKIQDRPLSIEAPKHINTHQYPVPVTSSDNHSPPSIASKLKRLSITTDPTNIGTAGDTHMVFQASSANTGKLFTLPPPTDENTTTHFLFTQRTGSTCYSDAEYHLPNGTLEQLHGVCTPTQGNRNTGPSGNTSQLHLNRTSLDKCTDGHENLTSNTAITTPMPTEPTMVPPNPPTAAGLIKDNGSNGVKESQTTIPGSDSLTYDHNVMRTPSLQSGSSIDSTDDSAEVDPIQASEDDHYAMITSGGIKPASCSKGVEKQKRQRCKHCVKYKEETNVLKVELNKLQRTLSREREQSNAQVASLREEIYHVEQHANYEITQCQIYVHNAEVRHQDAARTIQRLQRELQLVGKERDSIKNAYDSCLERCHMLEAELQRVDSMQCPEHHEQYDNTIAPNPISQQPNYYSVHTPRQSGVRHITTSLDD